LQGERVTSALRCREATTEPPEEAIETFLVASADLRKCGLAREAAPLGNRIIPDYNDDPQRAILVAREAIRTYGYRPRLHLALSSGRGMFC
jgi:hypothetical protein